MHEMSICEGIIEIIEMEATKQNFSMVKRVILEIGVLSGIEVKALIFCFEAVAKHSVANGAVLEIKQTDGQAWCMQCAKTLEVKTRHCPCPECASYQLAITGGDEMKITELEVE